MVINQLCIVTKTLLSKGDYPVVYLGRFCMVLLVGGFGAYPKIFCIFQPLTCDHLQSSHYSVLT